MVEVRDNEANTIELNEIGTQTDIIGIVRTSNAECQQSPREYFDNYSQTAIFTTIATQMSPQIKKVVVPDPEEPSVEHEPSLTIPAESISTQPDEVPKHQENVLSQENFESEEEKSPEIQSDENMEETV